MIFNESFEKLRREEPDIDLYRPTKLFRRTFSQDTQVRIHYHASLEINIFKNISGTMHLGSKVIDITTASAVIIPPGYLHSYRIHKSQGYIEVFHLSLESLRNWIDIAKVNNCFSAISPEALLVSDENQHPDFLTEFPESLFSALSYLFAVVNHLAYHGNRLQPPTPCHWLRRVVDYTEKHYADTPTIEQISQIAALSRTVFSRHFRRETGQTYHDYLLSVKLANAIAFLNSGRTITQCAMDTGFSDASHFIKVFKRKTGISPKKYQMSYIELTQQK